jgi:hypothetical protein
MSDYRFLIVKHDGIPCLHVMIDARDLSLTEMPIAHAYIPLHDIQEAVHISHHAALAELRQTLKGMSEVATLEQVVSVWNDVVETQTT